MIIMIEIIANDEKVKVDKTIDEVIGAKMDHQGEMFKLEALFEYSDGHRTFRRMSIDSTLTKEELEYIANAPLSKYSGSKVWNSSVWVYFDVKEKKIYRGSGCGTVIGGAFETVRGF